MYVFLFIYSILASISEKDQQGQSSNSGRFPGQVLDTLQQSQEQNIFWVWYHIFASNLQTTNCPFTIYRPSYTKVSSPALDQYPGISWWLPLPSFHNQHGIPKTTERSCSFILVGCSLLVLWGFPLAGTAKTHYIERTEAFSMRQPICIICCPSNCILSLFRKIMKYLKRRKSPKWCHSHW